MATDDPVVGMLHATTDAQIWAWEFLELVEAGTEITEGLMIGWFANALETGRRHA